MKRVGFTLVELLVVIAIIAILAAILFPVFAKVREKARQASCLSNEKEIGLSILAYNQDYDEHFPCGRLDYDNVNKDFSWGWAAQVYPYVKSTGVFACPDEAAASVTVGGTTYYPTSYGLNWNLTQAYPWNNNDPQPGLPGAPTPDLASLNSPAKTIMLFEKSGVLSPLTTGEEPLDFTNRYMSRTSDTLDDEGGSDVWATGAIDDPEDESQNHATAAYGVIARHTNGANYELADGHAKFILGSAICGGRNNSSPTLGSSDVSGDPAADGTEYSGTGAHAFTFSAI